jgi:hypothetical protein
MVCDFAYGEAIAATPVGAGGEGGAGGGEPSGCAPPPKAICAWSWEEPEPCMLAPGLGLAPLSPTTTWGDPNEALAGHSVVGTPAVLELDDDDCDGSVDAFDRPEIVFMTAATGASPWQGALHAAQVRNGLIELTWTAPPADPPNDPTSSIAAARMGLGAIIAVCTVDERVRAYDESGAERWLGPPSARCDSLAIADLQQDGGISVVSESQVFHASSGALMATYGPAPGHGFVIADVDDAHASELEIVTAGRIYRPNGLLLLDSELPDGFVAVGSDGAPVVISVDPMEAKMLMWRDDQGSAEVLSTYDLHAPFSQACPAGSNGALRSGGPPVVYGSIPSTKAWDVGVSTSRGFVTYRIGEPDPIWAYPRLDCDGGTRGSTAHDFDGDGLAEAAVYGPDSVELLGSDGSLLQSFCRTGEPGPAPPLVVDLDADRFGEVLTTRSARLGGLCQGAPQVGLGVLE